MMPASVAVQGDMTMVTKRSDAVSRAQADASKPVRKPYAAPSLVTYGGIRELTRQNGPHVNKDGGSNGVGSRT